jgi:hypothetical protein
MQRASGWLFSVSLVSLISTTAHATPTDQVHQAQVAYDEGLSLMNAGKVPEACTKFAASQQLDPALGTLLRLGDCFERSSRLASAFHTFQQAIVAAREANDSRETVAISRAAQIEPRIPRLAVFVPASRRGSTITRDAQPLSPDAYGIALPVDAGLHSLRVTTRNEPAWETTFTVLPDAGVQRIDIPEPMQTAPKEPTHSPSRFQTGSVLAWSFLGVGVAAMGTAVALGLDAKATYRQTASRCEGGCDDDAFAQREGAHGRASAATWLFVGGGVACAAWLALLVWPTRRNVHTSITLTPTSAFAEGRF